jgi:hypothetical protein
MRLEVFRVWESERCALAGQGLQFYWVEIRVKQGSSSVPKNVLSQPEQKVSHHRRHVTLKLIFFLIPSYCLPLTSPLREKKPTRPIPHIQYHTLLSFPSF